MGREESLSMMKNNAALQTNLSEQIDSSLIIAYKKDEGELVEQLDQSILQDIKPATALKVSKKKVEKVYRQLVPIKIYDELPAIEEEIKPFIKGYQNIYLLQIISIIAWHIRRDNDKARLQMKYLKRQVPQGDKYLRRLVIMGIVLRTGKPKKGLKCYEYSFADKYKSRYFEVFLYDRKLIRRLEQLQRKVEKEHKKTIWGHSKQQDFLKLLTIDASCYELIHTLSVDNPDRADNMLASAIRIDQQIHSCIRDTTSQRMHTNITNMAKELRHFLRIDGQPLVNIDIKNSQPFLSTILLTHPEKLASFAKTKQLEILLKEIKIPKSTDIALYVELVTSGGLYEYLMDEFSKEDFTLTRQETKKQVLRTLYAKNWKPKNPINRRAREIFIDRFPNVHTIFSRIRGRVKSENKKDEKLVTYKRFAILLQSIESHLVLDVIMKRIYKELPGVFAMTIHDSILTVNRPEVVTLIKGILEAELKNFVGYLPQLEVEWLGREKS